MEHITILLKENTTDNLKLLTEKLNEGYYINDRIVVGRSTVLALRKPQRETRDRYPVGIDVGELTAVSTGTF